MSNLPDYRDDLRKKDAQERKSRERNGVDLDTWLNFNAPCLPQSIEHYKNRLNDERSDLPEMHHRRKKSK